MKFTFFCLVSLSLLHAKTFVPKKTPPSTMSKQENLLTNILWEEVLQASRQYGGSEKSETREMSLGEMRVAAQKAKIRAQIAARNKIKPKLGGAELIEQQLAANRQRIKDKQNEPELTPYEKLQRKNLNFFKNQGMKVNKQMVEWRAKNQATLKEWAKEKDAFLGRVEVYKNNLIEVKIEDIVAPKYIESRIYKGPKKEFHLIPASIDIPVRDQGSRPTCAAFAGVRAIEILLAQNNNSLDLSEQYFYWASKPQCQAKKCDKKGSWVGSGFKFSKNKRFPDIPLENACPYVDTTVGGNETQVPLMKNCQRGHVKVESFKYLKSLDELLVALDNGSPVIGSFKLSENFYINNGMVLKSVADKLPMGRDAHAKGHAVLIEGYMKLPENLTETEGRYCFIVSNSWGRGWGQGGHSCLTENWVRAYRRGSPFVELNKVSMVD